MNNFQSNQAGFTLLETIVAFAILVMVLGVAFQVFSTGAYSQRIANEYSYATTIARSKLAQAQYIHSGQEGMEGNLYYWQIERLPYTLPEMTNESQQTGFHIEKFVVRVMWKSLGRERVIELEKIRLVNNE